MSVRGVIHPKRPSGSSRQTESKTVSGSLSTTASLDPVAGTNPAASATAGAALIKVQFPLPVPVAFDYLSDDGPLPPGAFVCAPFGKRHAIGVVWPTSGNPANAGRPEQPQDETPTPKPLTLKTIDRALAAPPLSTELIDFIDWTAAYTMTPVGSVLRLVMRSGDGVEPPAGPAGYFATIADPGNLTPARARILEAARQASAPLVAEELAQAAGTSVGVVRALAKTGALGVVRIDPDPPFENPDLSLPGPQLSDEQEEAANVLRAAVASGAAATILLDGVTGSGKTEVYLEAAAAALARSPEAQVLVMLPEIALTAPFLARLAARFGAEPAAWHSDLGTAARRRVWRRVADGQARLVIGARSALFLPFASLQLIIVDEEHESAYKQEDGVIYHARDMAVVRGARGGFPVILASATPSLETVVNVDQGRYGLARLPARFGSARLPKVSLVDLRKTLPETGRWLAPPLVDAVAERLAKGEQSLLFLNRRGYAPLTICRRCGHRMKSPTSDTFLVEHRFESRLVCHYTGYSAPKPPACPECGAVGGLSACGPGVERVAEEAAARWPHARIAVLSSDTAGGPAAMRATLEAMRTGGIDVLVATQIVAKGHHFPLLTFVGVVDADMGLAGGDLRAAERTFQLLSQVAGRAGRETGPDGRRAGEALLQTHQPGAPVLQALVDGDRDAFLAAEADGRMRLGFPPYGRLAAIVLSSPDETAALAAGRALKAAIPIADGVDVWGPAPAPIYRLRGDARLRFLVRARRDVRLQRYLAAWLAAAPIPARVKRTVDIDPYNFL